MALSTDLHSLYLYIHIAEEFLDRPIDRPTADTSRTPKSIKTKTVHLHVESLCSNAIDSNTLISASPMSTSKWAFISSSFPLPPLTLAVFYCPFNFIIAVVF